VNGEFLERFEAQYHLVFDEEGNVKACGRRACIALMEMCHDITGRPTTDFGNPSDYDGRMNIPAIKEVYKEHHI